MKILLIEDETNIAKPIIRVLNKNGFLVDYAEDGEKGLDLALLNHYDCLILDLNLPKIDGLEVAERINKAENNVPILMLTARSQIYDKLEGFKTGADDYLTKPFDFQELIARINALIKRSSANKSNDLKFKGFTLNTSTNNLSKEGSKKEVRLSNKETGMLEYLIRNKGRVISSEELLEHVWDTNINLFTDTVKTHIKTLRKKIGKDADLIKTIKGKGYLIES